MTFKYARGFGNYDNRPVPQEFDTFDLFRCALLTDRGTHKGRQWVTTQFREGPHVDKPDLGVAGWRCKKYVEPRRWFPLDLDGCSSMEAFTALVASCKDVSCFVYTTGNHTPENPRARLIFELTRPVDREEGILLGKAIEAGIVNYLSEHDYFFDSNVYRGEQPVYLPLHDAETHVIDGDPLDVDKLLQTYQGVALTAREGSDDFELVEVESDRADQEIIDEVRRSAKYNTLCEGKWQGQYKSQSEADFALLGRLCNATPSNVQAVRLFRQSGLGQRPKAQRNNYVDSMLRRLRAEIAKHEEVDFSKFSPPMPNPSSKPGQITASPQFPSSERELIVVSAADVQVRRVDWYWPGVFPIGAISILAGTAGTNKTTLGADIAGRGSAGLPWPDGSGNAPTGKVMFISGEDDASTTIVPRLMAARANLQNIDIVEGVRVLGTRTTFQLKEFIDLLEQHLESDTVRLILLDPLSAFVGATETHNDAQVRALLEPVRYLAETRGVAVIGIMHPPKMRYVDLVSRISGSAAFGNAARAVWYVQADPNVSERRYFLPAKLNLASDEFGFAYQRGQREVAGVGPQLCIEWEPQRIRKADVLELLDAKEDKSARSQIKCLILDCWEKGMTRATAIQEEAKRQGINMAPTTLTAAKKELGVRSVTQGFQGHSHWLPAEPVKERELTVK